MAVLTASITGLSLNAGSRALNASYTGKVEAPVSVGKRRHRIDYTDWLMTGRHYCLLAIAWGLS